MRVVYPDNTFITPIDKFGKIKISQTLILAESGYGKGLTTEGLAEWYHRHGFTVIVIADPKNEREYCYQMFKPREKYHLNHLNLISQYVGKWKLPNRHKVKTYHPYSNKIPTNRLLPEMNVFTIPIKELREKEWALLSEVSGRDLTVSLCLKAGREINNEEGLYSFLHKAEGLTESSKNTKTKKRDWSNFGLKATSGTAKEIMKVSNYVDDFEDNPFLVKQNSPYNLDWKEIINDQESYHVFITNYFGRGFTKLSDFVSLYAFESILKNVQYAKHPILIVIPELSYLCGFRPEGHKRFLAEAFKDNFKTVRSMGRGIATLSDGQMWGDIDEDARGSSTVQIMGRMADMKDVENIAKAQSWGKAIKEQLNSPSIPRTYLVNGIEEGSVDDGGYLFFYPSAMHCEREYNFEEMYREHHRQEPEVYPLISYKKIAEDIKKMHKEEINKLKAKEKRELEEQEKLEKEKEEKKLEKEKTKETQEDVKERVKESENKAKSILMKQGYEMKKENPKLSWRKLAEKLELPKSSGHKTIKKYVEEYEKLIEENQDKDFEDEFVESQ